MPHLVAPTAKLTMSNQHDPSVPPGTEPPAAPLDNPPSSGEYLHVAKLTGLIAGLLLAIYLAYRTVSAAIDVFMIGFLGILFAIFLRFLSKLLGRYTGLQYRKNLIILCAVLFTVLAGIAIFFGTSLYNQVQKGVEQFQAGGTEIIAAADEYPPLRAVIDASPLLQSFRDQGQASPSEQPRESDGARSEGASRSSRDTRGAADSGGSPRREETERPQAPGGAAARRSGEQASENDAPPSSPSNGGEQPDAQQSSGEEGGQSGMADMALSVTREISAFAGRFFVTTFGMLTNLVLIVIVGLYLAASPRAYTQAPTYLFPPRVRPDIERILELSGETLWRWLIGRFFSMSVSGIGAGVLLYLFGVPSALIIGILTFLLAFIPNVGPLLSMGIAMFFALPQGLSTVAIVIAVLSFFELLESYVVTPLVTEYQVSLPPALVIFFQALMGLTLGFVGLTVAAPLLAVAGVLFKEVYRKKLLKEPDVDDSPGWE